MICQILQEAGVRWVPERA